MHSSKSLAIIFSIVIAVCVLWPVTENFKKNPVDSFPLSYYPMFSYKRSQAHTLNYVVGYDTAGRRHYIPYNYTGSGGFNQVRRQLNKKIKQGRENEVLEKTAKRILKLNDAPYNKLVRLALAKGTFTFDKFFTDADKQPDKEKILAVKLMK